MGMIKRRKKSSNPTTELYTYLSGAITSLIISRLQDKIIGMDFKPYNMNRDFIINSCNEASIQMKNLNGKIPNVTKIPNNQENLFQEKKYQNDINWRLWKINRE